MVLLAHIHILTTLYASLCRKLKEHHLFNHGFPYFGIDQLHHPRLGHDQLMLERGRGKANKELAVAYIHFLCLERNRLAHHSLPTAYYRYFVELAL